MVTLGPEFAAPHVFRFVDLWCYVVLHLVIRPLGRTTDVIQTMEPLTGIEPVTSSLPRKCSTTELQRRIARFSRAAPVQCPRGSSPPPGVRLGSTFVRERADVASALSALTINSENS